MAATKTRFILILLVPMVVLLPSHALAWHEQDERENAKHGALGGDPRVLGDMAPCLEATQGVNGTTCTVLYAHILDLLNPVPLNTQRPADCVVDQARGFSGTPGVEPGWVFSRMDLYISPGFVEYPEDGEREDCMEPRLHPERELGDDVHISDDAPITFFWYLSADAVEFSPMQIGTGTDDPLPSLGAMPCLTVRATLETGRFAGQGEPLVQGTTTKTVVSTPYGQEASDLPVEDPCPGSTGAVTAEEVTEFRVELPPIDRSFEMIEQFVFQVQWYQHDGASPDPSDEDNLVQNDWNLRTGSEYRNRVVIPVKDPMRVLDLRVFEAPGNSLQNQIVLRSSWGAYDVDERNIRFEVVHADGTTIPVHHDPDPWDGSYHGHYNPRNLTFDWDPHADGLEPGTYTLRAIVPNWQHTAEAEAETVFTIQEDSLAQSGLLPAPASLVFLTLLMLLLIRHRERSRSR